MAEIEVTSTRLSRNKWRISFTNPGTAYVWRNGRLYTSTFADFVDMYVRDGEYATINVYDSSSDSQTDYVNPQTGRIQWERSEGAKAYRVYSGADCWGECEETGQWMYTFVTPLLTDCTSYTLKVVAVGANGEESELHTFTFYHVQEPSYPELVYTVTTGAITAVERT